MKPAHARTPIVEPPGSMRGLSLRQPWADAVVFGGKRIENRLKWTNSHFRGPFLIHASTGMTGREYEEVVGFVTERDLPWRPPPQHELAARMGGIIGVATVVGVVRRGEDPRLAIALPESEKDVQYRWWMGMFALILSDVRPTPFVPCTGRLGFFRVPGEIVARALGKAA
ncbi:MAG: hypothetical protein ACHREM_00315 [Polyangiales bacterium]